MKKTLILIIVCLCFSLSHFAQKGKPSQPSGCGSDARVRVSIDANNAIAPDMPGVSYVHGQENVEAIFQVGNCSHDFTMNLNSSNRFIRVALDTAYTSKFFNFDRVASVPLTPTDAVYSSAFLGSQFCTAAPLSLGGFNVASNPDGSYRDNYAGCAVDENGWGYVRRNVGIGLVAPSRKDQLGFRFQYSPIDGGVNAANVNGTSFIRVYHPNPTTWILVPDNQSNITLSTPEADSIPPTGVKLLNGAAAGNFVAPFRITVERLP